MKKQYRCPDPTKRLTKSIFWTTRWIAPIEEFHIVRWKYKGKPGQMVSAKHADDWPGFYHHLFEDYFISKDEYYGVGKGPKSYVYVEQRHWLNHYLYMRLYDLTELFVGWIPWVFEKIAYQMLKGTEHKYFTDDLPQSKSFRYRAWQKVSKWYMILLCNCNPFSNWRRSWVMAVKPPRIRLPKRKKK